MKIQYLNKDLQEKGLQKALEYSYQDHFVSKLLLGTGMRRHEPLKVYPTNIDFYNKNILVKGKGKKYRSIDIKTDIAHLLALWIKTKEIKNQEPILNISDQTIYNITYRHFNVNPHQLRHTYAIDLLRLTKNIRYVQKQLGHSSLKTTSVYLQFMDFEDEKKKLEEL